MTGTNEKHTVKHSPCQEFVSHVGKNVLIIVNLDGGCKRVLFVYSPFRPKREMQKSGNFNQILLTYS